MGKTDNTNIVVHFMAVLAPVFHDHAFGTLRCACAAAISSEVFSALVQPAAVRVVAIVTLMLPSNAQIVAHGHSTGFDLEGDLIFGIFTDVGETLRALRSCLFLTILLSLGISSFLC